MPHAYHLGDTTAAQSQADRESVRYIPTQEYAMKGIDTSRCDAETGAGEKAAFLRRDSAQQRIQDWAAVCKDGSVENLER